MMRLRWFRSIVLVAAVACVSCSELYDEIVFDNTPICTPDATRECHCDDGATGQQSCVATGDDYSACDCSFDAGVDGTEEVDGGTDAPLDAASAVDAAVDSMTP